MSDDGSPLYLDGQKHLRFDWNHASPEYKRNFLLCIGILFCLLMLQIAALPTRGHPVKATIVGFGAQGYTEEGETTYEPTLDVVYEHEGLYFLSEGHDLPGGVEQKQELSAINLGHAKKKLGDTIHCSVSRLNSTRTNISDDTFALIGTIVGLFMAVVIVAESEFFAVVMAGGWAAYVLYSMFSPASDQLDPNEYWALKNTAELVAQYRREPIDAPPEMEEGETMLQALARLDLRPDRLSLETIKGKYALCATKFYVKKPGEPLWFTKIYQPMTDLPAELLTED